MPESGRRDGSRAGGVATTVRRGDPAALGRYAMASNQEREAEPGATD
jgi:hypothetical protein